MYFICEAKNLLRIAEYCRVAKVYCTSVYGTMNGRWEFVIYGPYTQPWFGLVERLLFNYAFSLPGKEASCRICGAVLSRIEPFPAHCLHHYLRKMKHAPRCPVGLILVALEKHLWWREHLKTADLARGVPVDSE